MSTKIKDIIKQTDPQQKLRSENEHLRSIASQQESQIKKFLKEQGRFAELVENAAASIPPVSPYSTYTPKKNSVNQKNIGMVLKVSDWQIGEVIDPKETEGFGRFDYSIAKQRVFLLVDKIIASVEVQRKGGFALPQLDIFSEADLVSGNIHYELDVTNEWPVPIAIGKASELFAEMVRRLSTSFEHIKIWEMSADNHGRLTRKNQSKQGALNNYSRLAHEFANARLATLIEEGKVSVELGEGTKLLADVVGQKFLISHGHGILSSLGIPYYGLERARAREAVKRMGTDKNFQFYSIGHYHVASVIAGNILVNGNLPGTTEFDHMQGRNSPPTQVSFLVNPKHGIFDWTPWNLTKGTGEAN